MSLSCKHEVTKSSRITLRDFNFNSTDEMFEMFNKRCLKKHTRKNYISLKDFSQVDKISEKNKFGIGNQIFLIILEQMENESLDYNFIFNSCFFNHIYRNFKYSFFLNIDPPCNIHNRFYKLTKSLKRTPTKNRDYWNL